MNENGFKLGLDHLVDCELDECNVCTTFVSKYQDEVKDFIFTKDTLHKRLRTAIRHEENCHGNHDCPLCQQLLWYALAPRVLQKQMLEHPSKKHEPLNCY